MRALPMLTLLLLAPVLPACSGGGSSAATGDDQNATEIPVLKFDASFHATQTGPLVAGKQAQVHYDPQRLPDCRMGLNDGSPGWTITGFASSNGGTPRTFYVAGHSADPTVDAKHPPDATIDVPEGGDLALFFQVTNAQGCSAWDSSFGQNFHFPVKGGGGEGSRATVTLGHDGAPTVSGAIVAGGKVEIAYDPSRLPSCRMGLPNGAPGWMINGFSSLNHGPATGFHVAGFDPLPQGSGGNPVIDVPKAGRLELWFQVTSRDGCSAFDSNFSQNYAFDVAAR